ncbi:ATP-binding cassette domain-containing protein [bacterium]|nr:ATP-binding cassette domain-containing protein [bacterium]
MSSSSLMLMAKGLVAGYGGAPVLSGLDVDIPKGERWALAGANGAGKTTLLKLAGGVISISSGVLEVMGGNPSHASIRRRIGSLGAGDGFYPTMTGLENLLFFQSLNGECDRDDAERHLEGLSLVPSRMPVSAFSTGMRRRLALARLALGHHEVLLLDEPFRGLDTEGCAWLDSWLDARHQAGKGWILVSHDAGRITRHADHVARLAGGVVHAIERTGGVRR